MSSNTTLERGLVELNSEEVGRLVPLILFLSVIVLIGLPGNALVVLVYRRGSRMSISRYFIMCLGVSDLLSCGVVTMEIVNVVHQYTYGSSGLCKATIFLEVWPVMTSGGLLCAISVDRYRKVCQPFGWQITARAARITCAVLVFASFMCAWPALILFGVKTVQVHEPGVNGTECGILTEYLETTPSKVYNGLLWIIFVVSLSILFVLYCFIIKKIIRQPKKAHSSTIKVLKSSASQSSDQVESIEADSVSTSSSFRQGWRNTAFLTSSTSVNRTSNGRGVLQQGAERSSSQARTLRSSAYTMCVISVVFIASFLPYLVLRLLEALDPGYVQALSDAGRAAYKTGLRCYFLNCAVNPVVYCACSTYFRRDLLKIFRGLRRRIREN